MLLDDIEIIIRTKSDKKRAVTSVDIKNEKSTSITVRNGYSGSKKRQKYTVNGSGAYWKNGCALALVKTYLLEHPSTYHTIVSIFNGHIPNYVLSKEEVEGKAGQSIDRNITKRWHMDDPLASSDGITFYVTTQVGDGCPIDFRNIVSLSEELGYRIEPIDVPE